MISTMRDSIKNDMNELVQIMESEEIASDRMFLFEDTYLKLKAMFRRINMNMWQYILIYNTLCKNRDIYERHLHGPEPEFCA